jgi:hypothetical protein
MTKIIETCFQCPYWEDKRASWCKLLSKFITWPVKEMPDECTLENIKIKKTITESSHLEVKRITVFNPFRILF